jgi:hypothetical protein
VRSGSSWRSDIDLDPFDATYTAQPGGEPAAEPAAQTFWAASDSGTGPRTLTWQVSTGDWAIVIMNTDGSVGVEADVSAGATLPIIQTVAVISLVAGGLLLIGGITMIVVPLATRGPRPPETAA